MILVYGGSASGKSSYAEDRLLGMCEEGHKKYYIATMKVYGKEGQERVEKHRKLRAGKGFDTIECCMDIGNALTTADSDCYILLECLSNLVANEMYDCCESDISDSRFLSLEESEQSLCDTVVAGVRSLMNKCKDCVIVTNNVFEDGIVYDDSTKSYMRVLSKVNACLSDIADEVVEVIVGIPIRIK